jgi:hypothetical protein
MEMTFEIEHAITSFKTVTDLTRSVDLSVL